MIKVNLIPVRKKKKRKPVPTFLIVTVGVTLFVCIVMAYLVFFFNSKLSERKEQFSLNEKRIAELKAQIKAVDDFEKRNQMFKERNAIIEQLSKNKSIPVQILDEVSSLLPSGVWLSSMSMAGGGTSINMNISGFGYTNDEIVKYVDNLKGSKMFDEVFLQETRSTEIQKIPLYTFSLSFRLKA